MSWMSQGERVIATGKTDADGRINVFISQAENMEPGVYKDVKPVTISKAKI
ncbi:hydroxyisourate hydrolase [Klebsiella pneumoniae]|nr:hydroxyisourate hydrolase [Klebsiella pneumoniae]